MRTHKWSLFCFPNCQNVYMPPHERRGRERRKLWDFRNLNLEFAPEFVPKSYLNTQMSLSQAEIPSILDYNLQVKRITSQHKNLNLKLSKNLENRSFHIRFWIYNPTPFIDLRFNANTCSCWRMAWHSLGFPWSNSIFGLEQCSSSGGELRGSRCDMHVSVNMHAKSTVRTSRLFFCYF